jgi:hypothetical protein
LQSKKSVTKAEVQEYLDKNRVQIKEVTLGSSANPYPYRTADEWQGAIDRAERARDFNEAEKLTNAWEMFEGVGMSDQTKFSKYTLPGGENYREILLTLPNKNQFDPDKVEIVRNRQSVTQGSYTIKYDGKEVATFADELDVTDNYKGLSDAEIMDVAKSMHEQGNEKSGIKPISGAFKSGHFDQPNILAHIRVNDRVIDGKKTLFVEEVQSDWHQAGRKKGYTQPDLKPEDVRADFIPPNVPEGANPDNYPGYYEVFNKKTGELVTRAGGGLSPERAIQEAISIANATKSGVPDAPFKTTWSDLSMKRVIQMASEGGYDRIAFTTGKTQAERFDLSKQIGRVNYTEAGVLRAFDKDGKLVISKKLDSPDELEDYIGKEPAKKLLEQEVKGIRVDEIDGKPIAYGNPNVFDGRELSGVDLSVGGEGMKGFYDDILPKFLDKYAKKWDAKTGVTDLVIEKAGSKYPANIRTLEGGSVRRASDKTVPVNYIDVTPKMRESVVTKGQPMFAIGAGGAGAAATQEENK